MHVALTTSHHFTQRTRRVLLEADLAWLHEELAAAQTREQRASLLYQMGALELLAGRDERARQRLHAAVEALPELEAPLDGLIALAERARAPEQLAPLLERRLRGAVGAEEEADAAVALACFLLCHGSGAGRALALAGAALTTCPQHGSAAVVLEVAARRCSDGPALVRALQAQLELATEPDWAALLGIELARELVRAGAEAPARARLVAAAALPTAAAALALDELEARGRESGRHDWTLQALELRATRALAATSSDASAVDGAAAGALDALLSKSVLEGELGRDEEAVATLERAAALAPEDAVVARRLLAHAARAGRHELVEALAARELGLQPTNAEASWLWLMLARSRAERGEREAALAASRQALALEPSCWLARAQELELLRREASAESRALALEQAARDLNDGGARSRCWLLAAEARCRSSPAQAREALAEAERSGAAAALVRRLERALAQVAGDASWYDAAVTRLLDSDLDGGERAALGLDAWRRRWLRGEGPRAGEVLRLVSGSSAAGRRAAGIAFAYAPGAAATPEEAAKALAELAAAEPQAPRAAALGWAAALRARRAGDVAGALAALGRRHAAEPGLPVLAGTLAAWYRAAGEPLRAADVLQATARALPPGPLAAALFVEAGLSRWRLGEREQAWQAFQAGERSAGVSGRGALSSWARRVLDGAPEQDDGDRVLAALERATRSATPGAQELHALSVALRAPGQASPACQGAAQLAQLVLARRLGVRVDAADLERALRLDAGLAPLAACFRYLECLAQHEPAPRALEESARGWVERGGGLAACLEWVVACSRLGQRPLESLARRRLAALLPEPAREHALASAALVTQLTASNAPPLLEGRGAVSALTNLETSPPGSEPRRRAQALEAASGVLGDDSAPLLALLGGYNLLAAGDDEAAIRGFRRHAEAYPEDPSGWEGLLAAARRTGDAALIAEAASRLAATCRDPSQAASLFEEAGLVCLDQLGDAAAGRAALRRAVELDIGRASSFTRLLQLELELERGAAASAELAALIERRLPLAAGPERAALAWELARARRESGDEAGALSSLELVLALDPDHLGAAALLAELYIARDRPAEAVERLARIVGHPDASPEQRLTSGVVAIDLCEEKLGANDRALQLLSQLSRAGLSTRALRERHALCAARAGAWDEAVVALEQLMLERETAAERAEAARLALAIHRDRRGAPGAAGRAARRLLELVPADPEAIELVLSGCLQPELERELLEAAKADLIGATARSPTDLEGLRRLARVAGALGDVELRQATLGALVALGGARDDSRLELVSLERRISTVPPASVSRDVLAELADPEDQGPIAELLEAASPHLATVFGPTRDSFRVGRRERVSAARGGALHAEISAWVRAFGGDELELYVTAVPSERLVVLETRPPTIIAGASVSAPLGPFQRLSLARSLYAMRRGLGPLLQLDESEVEPLIAALCSVVGVDGDGGLGGGASSRQRALEQLLKKALPRRARRQLAERARAARSAAPSLQRWVRAATASLDRVAAVAVGDPSVILADAPARDLPAPANEERARRLLGFMLSPEFQELRQRFGVSIR